MVAQTWMSIVKKELYVYIVNSFIIIAIIIIKAWLL